MTCVRVTAWARRRGGPGGTSATSLGPRWGSSGPGASPGSGSLGAWETLVPPRGGSASDLTPATAAAAAARVVLVNPTARAGRLGRYHLVERLGQGRQADVWRAVCRDPGWPADEVALKVLPPTGAGLDPRRRAQLRREAERGARLTGPALLPTYEYGEADGAAFMAMPLVAGCTLADVIAQRRDLRDGFGAPGAHALAVAPEPDYTREVVSVLARVARAAHDAHAGLVAHRDIKPGNVLVCHDHGAGVFLCDFGLARDLDVATPGQLRDGAGSPLYMAPERLLKRPADEVRGDVFALGVTLCEALTLSTPVEVPVGMPRECWPSYLAYARPLRPSDLRPSVPPALEAVVLRATARDPARHHPTAAEFADDLDRYLASPPAAPRRWPWRGARPWAARA